MVVGFGKHFNKKISEIKVTCIYIYLMLIFSHLTFDNDGMNSSKRQVTFTSLIFLLKCF